MNNGWITLHRKIEKHWLWDSKPFSRGQAWIDILLECNHSERKGLFDGKLITTKRGQSSNSKKTWAHRWGWSISATRHFITLLENDEMISTHNARVTTVLSVLNYDTYQAQQPSEESQKNLTKISDESHADTNNKVKKAKNLKNDKNLYRRVQHLTISLDELQKLKNAGYVEADIIDVLDAMENSSKLKNYKSGYLTALNWLKIRQKNKPVTAERPTLLQKYTCGECGTPYKESFEDYMKHGGLCPQHQQQETGK